MRNETEQKILESARSIFIQKGFAGARMQEIADKAEINKAMLHYYFRSKQQLFERILKLNIEIVAPKMVEAMVAPGTVLEKFERLVDSYIDTILQHPHIPMFLLHEMSQRRTTSVTYMKQVLTNNAIISSLFTQIKEEQAKGILKKMSPLQMWLSVLSLIVFPFEARPVFQFILDIPGEQYNQIMLERKTFVKDFIRSAIVP